MAFLPLIAAGLSIAGGFAAKRNADADAETLNELGIVEAEDSLRQTRRLLASQQVAFAKAGVATTVGTPLDVFGDTVAEAELAALRIRFGRNNEAAGLRQRGKEAQLSGILSGISTVLGGVGSSQKRSGTGISSSQRRRGI